MIDAKIHHWHYESDGEQTGRTHYAVRENWDTPLGIERMDFRTASAAREFINRSNALIDRVAADARWRDAAERRKTIRVVH